MTTLPACVTLPPLPIDCVATDGTQSAVHAYTSPYAAQQSSVLSAKGATSWKPVGQPRQRLPRPEQKGAIPGSSLDRKLDRKGRPATGDGERLRILGGDSTTALPPVSAVKPVYSQHVSTRELGTVASLPAIHVK